MKESLFRDIMFDIGTLIDDMNLSYDDLIVLLDNVDDIANSIGSEIQNLIDQKREVEEKKQKAIKLMDEALTLINELKEDGYISTSFYDKDGDYIVDPIFTTVDDMWQIEDYEKLMGGDAD